MIEVFRVEDLSLILEGQEILKAVSFSVREGELIALVGGNGAGKTTLLKALMGQLKPSQGRVLFRGRPAVSWGDSIFEDLGVVLQNPDHQLFSFSVKEEIEFVQRNFGKKGDAGALLEKFKFSRFADRVPFFLSEGEKKKLCIISILAHDPPVFLFDEPFALLDWGEKENILALILELNGRGKTILVVTHDLFLIEKFPRALALEDGRLVADGKVAEAFRELGVRVKGDDFEGSLSV